MGKRKIFICDTNYLEKPFDSIIKIEIGQMEIDYNLYRETVNEVCIGGDGSGLQHLK